MNNYKQLITKIIELCLGGYDSLEISMMLRVPHDVVYESLMHTFSIGNLILDENGAPALTIPKKINII